MTLCLNFDVEKYLKAKKSWKFSFGNGIRSGIGGLKLDNSASPLTEDVFSHLHLHFILYYYDLTWGNEPSMNVRLT